MGKRKEKSWKIRGESMRTSRRLQQKMFYALHGGSDPVYKLDALGEPIIDYVDELGNIYPVETGTMKEWFLSPVEFWASITSKLNEIQARAFGVDQTNIYSILTVEKGKLPITYGTKIWKDTVISYEKGHNDRPDASTADYTVKGIMTEFQNYDQFLLMRNNNVGE